MTWFSAAEADGEAGLSPCADRPLLHQQQWWITSEEAVVDCVMRERDVTCT